MARGAELAVNGLGGIQRRRTATQARVETENRRHRGARRERPAGGGRRRVAVLDEGTGVDASWKIAEENDLPL